MTSETILTDEQVRDLVYEEKVGITLHKDQSDEQLVRATEQSVLQSEQVQAWKKDAERMEWYFGSADKTPWVPEYMRGCNDGWSVDQWRMSIDAAMEKQK